MGTITLKGQRGAGKDTPVSNHAQQSKSADNLSDGNGETGATGTGSQAEHIAARKRRDTAILRSILTGTPSILRK